MSLKNLWQNELDPTSLNLNFLRIVFKKTERVVSFSCLIKCKFFQLECFKNKLQKPGSIFSTYSQHFTLSLRRNHIHVHQYASKDIFHDRNYLKFQF